MEKITSMHNPRVQAWRSLKTKSGREAEGAFLVEGFKSVGEALSSSFELLALIVEDGTFLPDGAPEGRTFVVPAHLMAAVCDTKTPQGIAAVMQLKPRTVTGKRLLALDGVQDPGNVGTILRTADAAGLDGILYSSQCADPYSPKVLRASMGSVFHLPVEEVPDLAARLKTLDMPVLASRLDGDPFFPILKTLPDTWCLIIGNEGNGISPEVTASASHLVRLPMHGAAESLNAAVAAGIMMYALTNRQDL